MRCSSAVVRLNECLELIDVRPAPEVLGRFTGRYLEEWAGRAVRFGGCLR